MADHLESIARHMDAQAPAAPPVDARLASIRVSLTSRLAMAAATGTDPFPGDRQLYLAFAEIDRLTERCRELQRAATEVSAAADGLRAEVGGLRAELRRHGL